MDFYRTHLQFEFCFCDAKQHAGMTNCLSIDYRKLAFYFRSNKLCKGCLLEDGNEIFHIIMRVCHAHIYMLERFFLRVWD